MLACWRTTAYSLSTANSTFICCERNNGLESNSLKPKKRETHGLKRAEREVEEARVGREKPQKGFKDTARDVPFQMLKLWLGQFKDLLEKIFLGRGHTGGEGLQMRSRIPSTNCIRRGGGYCEQ
ncbi:hypothetical protein HPP92_021515 [Vanilla planifolia]|uniref:Uncharacterized protein n=1 Tax=Vanilla planifolia TaxID=51239 RepID=A0A835PZZ7_VANPL|nr:hypothetical protein HPP92_021880 [Vanilla planifolia]KAG0463039.1 hypothetical protein HPP92_021515 [Vanilla planifolia]